MKAEPEQWRLNVTTFCVCRQNKFHLNVNCKHEACKKTKQNKTKHQCDLKQLLLSVISLKFQPPSFAMVSQIRTTR